jgi:hypothetical protein
MQHAGGAVSLDDFTRAELARHWLEDARLEHASVASFARFVLHLLALGAPPELVTAAERALGDAGEPLRGASRGSGAALARGLRRRDNRRPARGGQLDQATDSEASTALERIASDEAEHAKLAWRFVRWAIDSGGEPVRRGVRAAFAEARRRLSLESAAAAADDDRLDIDAWHAHSVGGGVARGPKECAPGRGSRVWIACAMIHPVAGPSDTHPAVEALLIEGYRHMSPADKLRRVEALNETVLQLAATRIRQEHPGLSDRGLRYRLASLWLDRALLERAFGTDPDGA